MPLDSWVSFIVHTTFLELQSKTALQNYLKTAEVVGDLLLNTSILKALANLFTSICDFGASGDLDYTRRAVRSYFMLPFTCFFTF